MVSKDKTFLSILTDAPIILNPIVKIESSPKKFPICVQDMMSPKQRIFQRTTKAAINLTAPNEDILGDLRVPSLLETQ